MGSDERPLSALETLAVWYEQALGRQVWHAESELLERLLERRQLPRALVIGGPPVARALCATRNRVLLGPRPPAHGDLWASPEELPLLAQSFDLVLLVHVLEYSSYPAALLAETRRVLASEGLLATVVFNPYSFRALRSRLKGEGNGMPGRGRSWPLWVIHRGLRQAGLAPVHSEGVRLPAARPSLLDPLRRWMPGTAVSHVVVGRRRDIGTTPLAVRPTFARRLMPGNIPEATARNFP